MKKKNHSKKDIRRRFESRAKTHKRDGKAAVERALRRLAEDTGVRTDGAKFHDTILPIRRKNSQNSKENMTIQGIFSLTKSGFGFVHAEGLARDIFIPRGKTGGAVGGDTVEVRYRVYTDMGEEKTEGRVVRVTDGVRTLIGTLAEEIVPGRHRRRTILCPDDRSFGILPVVRDKGTARIGDKAEVLLRRDGDMLSCDVIRTFGAADTKEANYGAILADCGIETEFPPEALAVAEAAARRPMGEGRQDRRAEVIFTMDGADAKDLDDAVSVRRLPGGGYRLGVHIADVSYYVDEKTALDRDVMARGNSVYFTDKVVPMLPTCLSNGVCSLNAGEDKAVLSAVMTLSPEGDILKTDITPSVIRSRVRGVYGEVNSVLAEGEHSPYRKKYAPVRHALSVMCELYDVLYKKSRARGAMELESEEARIVLDGDGRPVDIVRRERGTAERMIEQFMLTANEGVATYLTEHSYPCVYRVHARPDPEKMHAFLAYLAGLSVDIRGLSPDTLTGCDLSRVLDEAKERGVALPVSYTLLRSMAKAEYKSHRENHFGLALENYCHFTSPIRRLSDLAVHRILRRAVLGDEPAGRFVSYAARAARAATEAERRTLEAERRIESLYKVLYMKEKVGETFPAVVTSVTPFGVFCTLENTCEGLIPRSDMPGEYIYDEKTCTLRSRDMTYRLGDAVTVRLEEADMSAGKLRFSDMRHFTI